VNEVVMLRGYEPKRILEKISENQVPVAMCYLSRGKWHVAKVLLGDVKNDTMTMMSLPSMRKSSSSGGSDVLRPRPINVQVGQSVGMSVKYETGKFIFETKVYDFVLSGGSGNGGMIMLEVPEQIEMIPRRSYFRVRVPSKLKVDVDIWLRNCQGRTDVKKGHKCTGRLIDMSAGGFQMAINADQNPELKQGQFVKIKFSPLPTEAVIECSAQIRNILPTADGESLCFGLQVVGLEASDQGHQILSRLVAVTELYYELSKPEIALQRNADISVMTKTFVKNCRSEWGDLLSQ